MQVSVTGYSLTANVERLFVDSASGLAATGNTLDNSLTGNSGNDTLDGGAGNDTLTGGTGDDTYRVDSLTDSVIEALNEGTDTVQVSITGYTLVGNVENLYIDSTVGLAATGNALANVITGNMGNDTLEGGTGNDTLLGSAGADSIADSAGDDSLDGGTGNDTLQAGVGNDTVVFDADDAIVDGGAGVNTLKFGASVDLVSLSTLPSNFEIFDIAGTAAYIVVRHQEMRSILASGTTTFKIDGDSGDVVNVSEPWIKGATANGYVAYTYTESTVTLTMQVKVGVGVQFNVTGSSGDDTLVGDALNDTLLGMDGNDSLDGSTGADSLIGGAGDDTYVVDNVGDIATETLSDGSDAGGTDTVKTDLANYTLPTYIEAGVITGTGGTSLTGNSLDNTLTGGAGVDTIAGGSGNDLYIVQSSDVLSDSAGVDTVRTDSSSFTLGADFEHLEYSGSSAFTGTGNTANNSLTGGSGSDTLSGDAGNDTLDGGTGSDSLSGGDGDDIILVDTQSDSVSGGTGTDEVRTTGSYSMATTATDVEKLTYVGSGNAALTGNTLANLITGGAGNDTLDGGTGADSLVGGAGNDTLLYDTNDVLVSGGSGDDTLLFQTNANWLSASTLPTSIETIDLTGSAAALSLSAVKVRTVLAAGNDILIVNGDVGDAIEVNELWSSAGVIEPGYNDYTRTDGSGGNVTLRLKAGVLLNQIVVGTQIYNSGEATSETNNPANPSGADTLPGGLGNDNITGLSGNDSLTGADGNDTLKGDQGEDTLDGGAGNDNLQGGAGNDIYVVDSVNDVVDEASNTDTDDEVRTTLTSYTLASTLEHLSFLSGDDSSGVGNNSANRLSGSSGFDTLAGGSGNDTLLGNGGNDSLAGGTGNDSMVGGTGSDYYLVDSADDAVVESVNQGDDTVETGLATYTLAADVERLILTNTAGVTASGNSLANTINGNSGNDNLSGLGGSDTLIGSTGDDTLDGGTGADSLVGGAGNDRYVIDDINDIVDETGNNTTDNADEVVSSLATTILAENVEKLTLTAAGDAVGYGNTLDNTLTGAAGNDSLLGGEGHDTVSGGDGNDTLEGGVGNDSLEGGNHNDSLVGGEGNDTMLGGAGNDVYVVDSANDSVSDSAGTDEIQTTLTTYTLASGIEKLTFTGLGDFAGTGTSSADTIVGGIGADTLDGLAGNDTLIGGRGSDLYKLDSASDVVTEISGEGMDTVEMGDASYTLADNVEVLKYTGGSVAATLTGNASANRIEGGSGADSLFGGNGSDTSRDVLIGGAGNDTLDGSQGADSLVGGADDDLYIVDNADDQVVEDSITNSGTDTVKTSLANLLLADNVEKLEYTGSGNFRGVGNDLANTIVSGVGDDTLEGGLGDDTMIGGAGNDIYVVSGNDSVSDSSGTADEIRSYNSFSLAASASGIENLTSIAATALTLTGDTSANVIKANADYNVDDTLIGGAENDTLYGYGGADSLVGGTGNDSLIGGTGNDIYDVDHADDVTYETANQGLDTVQTALTSYTLQDNVEDLELSGTDVAATGNALDNSITGAAGNDTLDGAAGNDILIGGAGNDVYITDGNDVITEVGAGDTADEIQSTVDFSIASLSTVENLSSASTATTGLALTGNSGANTLKGHASGNFADTLDGGTGADAMLGYDGNDVYIVDDAGDTVTEASGANTGTDEIKTALSSLTIAANVEKLTYTGTADFTGTGDTGNETISGAAGNDTLSGLSGNDSLDGAAGNDVLKGGAGNDTLSGGANFDIADYTGEAGAIYVNLSGATADGVASGTAKVGTTDVDTLQDIEGFIGTTGVDTMLGGAGNDFFDGNGGNDSLVGGDGNDIYVVNGTDTYSIVELNGTGGGIDELRIRPVGTTVSNFSMPANVEKLTFISTGNLTISGAGYITGGSGNDTISTGNANDTIDGGAGNDSLVGGDGDDVYIINSGNDTINDTSGTDEIRTALASFDLTVNDGGAPFAAYLLPDIEKLTYTGTGDFSAIGKSWVNETIVGGAGNDTLKGGTNDNDTLDGGLGSDIASYVGIDAINADLTLQTVTVSSDIDKLISIEGIIGSNNTDTITGSTGNDYLNAGTGGSDTLTGLAGDDIYVVDHTGVTVIEGATAGNDTVRTYVSTSYTLAANIENLEYIGGTTADFTGSVDANRIVGGSGNDSLRGDAGNDTLDGGLGNDSLVGGADDDLYLVDNVNDVVVEASNEGTDTVRTSLATYTLAANVENLEFTGTGAVNFTGSNVGNVLTGGAGNDTLNGMAGADTLTGGAGDDLYHVDDLGDSVTDSSGSDEIKVTVTGYTLATGIEKGTVNTTTGIALSGNALDNTLAGNNGNDTLDGGAGRDTMSGGSGNDVYVVDDLRDSVTDSSGTADEIRTTLNDYTVTTASGVEKLTFIGTGNFVGTGTSGSQTITGGAGDDTLDGGAGTDTLVGGDGADVFIVDMQSESISGGAGTDEVRTTQTTLSIAGWTDVEKLTFTGAGNATLTGNTAANTLTGSTGKDTLDGGTGADTLVGGENDDVYIDNDNLDTITELVGGGVDEIRTSKTSYTLGAANIEKLTYTGGATATYLTGYTGDDSITGGSGNDTLDGSTGVDTLVGGLGNDIYYVDSEADVITESSGQGTDEVRTTSSSITLAANVEILTYVGSGNFTAIGTANGDSINGGNQDDNISGLAGNDSLGGNGGNDTLDGGAGNDTLVGGAGNDVYIVDTLSDSISDVSGTDEIRTTLNTVSFASNFTTSGVENLTFIGSSGNATLTGGSGDNVLTGASGNDTLSGADGNDTLIGGMGADSLVGGNHNDSLVGGDGADSLDGGAGNDTLVGGAGGDYYFNVDNANDVIDEAANGGIDVVVQSTVTSFDLTTLAANVEGVKYTGSSNFTGLGSSGDNWIEANTGNDTLKGNAGADTLIGGTGNDFLDGGAGVDSLVGGDGNDIYVVDDSSDIIVDSAGSADEVRVMATSYVLSGGLERLSYVQADGVTAGTSDFTGTGNSTNETITGGTGNDNLSGAGGNDSLNGGNGNDTLDGGTGNDTMVGGAGDDVYIVDSASDSISDASGSDEVRVSLASYTLVAANIEKLVFTGLGNASLTGSSDSQSVVGGSGDDVLSGGTAGADTLIGGAGNDVYIVNSADDVVTESGTSDTADEIRTSVAYSIAANIENLTSAASVGIVLSGNAAHNVLKGNSTSALAETLVGGDGNDTLLGYDGADSMSGGNDVDSIEGGAGNDSMDGGSGNDVLKGGAGNDSLAAGDGEDMLYGGDANDTVGGDTGADTLDGGAGNDTVYAGGGNDNVVGGTGNDTIDLGDGNDTAAGGADNDTLIGSAGNDSLVGDAGNDSLLGGAGNDTLDGGGDADTLLGGDGDDMLVIDTADSSVDGAAGTDSLVVKAAELSFSTLATSITNIEAIDLRAASGATVSNAITLNNAKVRAYITNITDSNKTLTVHGDAGDSILLVGLWSRGTTVDISGTLYRIYTSTGTDTVKEVVRISNNMDVVLQIVGTSNDDLLYGTTSGDRLEGLAGNDTIYADDGGDILVGGTGNDILDGQNGLDTADYSDETGSVSVTLGNAPTNGSSNGTSTGIDTLINIENVTGSSGNDTLTGNDDYNVLSGAAGNDTLSGGIGFDTLIGGTGNDSLSGGADDDVLRGGAGDDTLSGGTGNDLADYAEESNAVTVSLATGQATGSSIGTDTLNGIEKVTGGSGADTLTGDSAANVLDGGSGNDTIAGGAGNDTLSGGAGTDTLDYAASTGNVTVNLSSSTYFSVAAGTAIDGLSGTDTLTGFEYINGGSGNDTLIGSTGDNLIAGNNGNDLLIGDAGVDTLQGGAGDDSLRGGAGNDVLDGGTHNVGAGDTADYSDQTTAVTVNLGTSTATGGSIGTDTLSNIENISGSSQNDTLTGDANANQLWGNSGNDTLVGAAGNDSLRGGQGDDSLDGGADVDTVYFDDVNGPVIVNLSGSSITRYVTTATGAYAATSSGSTTTYTVTAGQAKTVTQVSGSNAGIDTLANIENIVGSAGADVLIGSSAANVIDGGTGGDEINAGDGDDIIYYDENDTTVEAGLGSDTLVVKSSATMLDLTLARDDIYLNFEMVDLTVTGSQILKLSDADVKALTGGQATGTLLVKGTATDSVRLVGAAWPTAAYDLTTNPSGYTTETINSVDYNVFTYNGATVKIQQGVAVGYVLRGTEGDDPTFNSTAGSDEVYALGGNDTIAANAGDDLVDAGAGNDSIAADAGNDSVLAGTGNDTVTGGTGNDSIDAGDGDDSVDAGDDSDTITGGLGNDTLLAGAGNDSVIAGDGNDSVDLGSGDDTLDAGSGNDIIAGGAGNDSIIGGIGDDSIKGGLGNDTMDAGTGTDLLDYSDATNAVTVNLLTGTASGADIGTDTLSNFDNITGGNANDALTGSDVANRIIGGAGADTITANAGNDWVEFDTNDALVDGGQGVDSLAITTGTTVDFTVLANSQFVGFEEFDLTGNGVQTVKMSAVDILNFSDTSDTLKIHGDAGDKLTLTGNWTLSGTPQPVSYNGGATQQYAKLTALVGEMTVTVLVDPAITLSIAYEGTDDVNDTLIGGSGNDTMTGAGGNDSLTGGLGADSILGGEGNDTILYDAADLLADGGPDVVAPTDTDTLKFDSTASGLVLDFGDIARPTAGGVRPALAGFEVIDITGGGNNTLIIDSASLVNLSDTDILTVDGNAGDTVYLVGSSLASSWGSPVLTGGYNEYIYNSTSTKIRVKSGVTVGFVVDDPNADSDSANPLVGGVSTTPDVIRGLGGNDTIDGGTGNDILRGGDGDDVLIYDANDVAADGGNGTDTLRLASTTTTLNLAGVAGAKVSSVEVIDLVTGAPAATLTATASDIAAINATATLKVDGDGSDRVSLLGNWVEGATTSGYTAYTLNGSTVNVKAGLPVSITYTGTAQIDTLTSYAGNQTLEGLAANDTLDGGAGNDTLLGGDGDDSFIYDANDGSISGGNGSNDNLVITGSGYTLDLTSIANTVITSIEKIDLTGTGNNTVLLTADDVQAMTSANLLIITGNAGDTARLAGAGWEARGSQLAGGVTYAKYVAYSSDSTQVTVLLGLNVTKGNQTYGTSGNDTLTGGSGADNIDGLGGNDSIDGAGGADLLYGGAGADTIVYDGADTTIDGGTEGDTLLVSSAGQIIDLQDTENSLTPVISGIETINLNITSANYVIIDQATLNAVSGGALTISGTSSDVVFVDGSITDLTLSGGVIQTALTKGDASANTLTGTAGQDGIKAGAGNDTIDGAAAADIIYAEAGDDRVIYDAADIRVFGGAGTDTLVVNTVDADGSVSKTKAPYTNSTAGDVDLTLVSSSVLKGFEVIDMSGNGTNQTVKLDAPTILGMSDTGHMLVKGDTIVGDNGDSLKLYGSWVYDSVESDVDGNLYTVLQKGLAYVHVAASVTIDIVNELGGHVPIQTPGADDVTVAANGGVMTGDGDDIIRIPYLNFTGVDGGRGYDKVYFTNTGSPAISTINTALFAQTALTNVEEITLNYENSTTTNKLILTPDTLANMTDEDKILVVKGNASYDSIDIYGTWADAVDATYNGVAYKLMVADNGAKLYYTPGLTVTKVNPTDQVSAFSVSATDSAYLVSSGVDLYAGWRVDNAGDVNKDGIADMIVNQMGSAYVVFGTQSMMGQIDLNNLGSRGFKVSGIGSTDLTSGNNMISAEYGLTGIGDINGDGIADMAANVNGNPNQTVIIYGRTTWTDIDITNTSTFVSSSTNGFRVNTSGFSSAYYSTISAVGDVNNDGYLDYALGNSYGDTYGKVYLMFGGVYGGDITTSSMNALKGVTFSADSNNPGHIGADIAAIGDLNNDGYVDFAIGAPGYSEGASATRQPYNQYDYSGAGYIVFGKAEGWANSQFVLRDVVAPTVTSLTPTDNATGQSQIANLTMNFSEYIALGTGYISLFNKDTGALVERFDAATGLGSQGGTFAVYSNTQLQINPYSALGTNANYYVTVAPTAIKDLAGNTYAGIADNSTWNFTTSTSVLSDTTAPSLSSSSFTYIGPYSGYPSYTYNYTQSISSGSTLGRTAPQDSIQSNPYFYFNFNFSENIRPYGTIKVMDSGGTVYETFNLQTGISDKGGKILNSGYSNQAFDYSSYKMDLGTTFKGSTTYYLRFSGIMDSAGNAMNSGANYDLTIYTPGDSTAPVLSGFYGQNTQIDTPAGNGNSGISVENNIVIYSPETLKGGSGTLYIKNYSTDAVIEQFSVTSGATSVVGSNGGMLTINNKTITINPGANLGYNTTYYIQAANGVFTDLTGNAATGLAAKSDHYFTTNTGFNTVAGGNAVDHSLKVGVADNIEITFAETTAAGTSTAASKYIKLYNNQGTLIESFDVATGLGSKGGTVSFSGYKVIVNPFQDLAQASGYYLTVDAQAVKAANAASATYMTPVTASSSAGIFTSGLWFNTEAASQIDIGQSNAYQQWGGQQIESVGDVDGDGINDFVIGSYQTVGSKYGVYYLVFGQAGIWPSAQNIQDLKNAGRAIEFYSSQSTNRLSRVVEFGDMNLDGFDDLLFTAGGLYPDNDASATDREASNDGDIDAGAAFIVYGKSRASWATALDVTQLGQGGMEITGGLPQEQLGFSAATGDFNQDGIVDIVFGMPVNHRDGYASGEAWVLNGGDYSDSVISVGTTGNDNIIGDFNANRIAGQQGNDTIVGLGGADILRGGAGDDVIGIGDLDFYLVDGGTQNTQNLTGPGDSLRFIGHDINLDMTGRAGSSIRSFETVDLTGDGNNSLTINYREVYYLLERQLSQAYGLNGVGPVRLNVEGNAGDKLTLEGPWAQVQTGVTDTYYGVSNTYNIYALDGLYVKVDADVTTTVDTWTVPYTGATLNLAALPSGIRSTALTFGSMDYTTAVNNGSQSSAGSGNFYSGYLVNVGDVNNDGFADFALRQNELSNKSLPYFYRYESSSQHTIPETRYDYYGNPYTAWVWDGSTYDHTVQSYEASVGTNLWKGEVYVVYGQAGGLTSDSLTNLVNSTKASRFGSDTEMYDGLGSYLSSLGDVNGDGKSDFAIGAQYSATRFTFTEGGANAYNGTFNNTSNYYTWNNTTSGSQSSSWSSDSWSLSYAGRQYVFLGGDNDLVSKSSGALQDFTLSNTSGSLGTVSDLPTASGLPNASNTPATSYFDYTNSSLRASASWVGTGNDQVGNASYQGTSVGDVNGDGYDDFVQAARAKLVLGSSAGWTGTDNTTNSWTQKNINAGGSAPQYVTAAGDVNGDGYADILMNYSGDNAGAYLSFGKAGTGWDATSSYRVSSAGSSTVAASTYISQESTAMPLNPMFMRGIGDVNGDGYDDLMFVAQPGNDYSAKDNGGLYVLFGASSGWGSNVSLSGLATAGKGFRISGAADYDYAGYNATNAGDINGDGYTDFLVTAQGDDKALNASGNTNGVAYLIFGRSTGWADFSLLEPQEYGIEILGAANMNYTWETMGDVDGDGYDDLSYSTSTATTILYGSEQMTSGSNVGAQHVTTTTGGTLTANPAITLFSDLDRLVGNAGNDTLIGDGGADVLIGGAGNDLLKVADPTFFKLDGGTGIDVVEVTAAATLNFNNITNQRVEAIEVLNLGSGNQAVTLSGMDVLNMTENTNTAINNSTYQKGHVLVIDSSAGTDSVTLNGGWTTTAVATSQTLTSTSFGSGSFSVYQFGSSNIYAAIDDAITKSIS